MQQIKLDHFLDLDLPFFEPRNERRGGWSGVSRVQWSGQAYFIKRQVNHAYREPRRFFMRTPTLRREYRNTIRLSKINIQTPEIVIYSEDGPNAMLITRELSGYIDLDAYLPTATTEQRTEMLASLLEITSRMHQNAYRHGCLYGKHIMVNCDNPSDIAVIDLEKMKYSPWKRSNAVRDICQLIRHTDSWSDGEIESIRTSYEKRFSGFTDELGKRMEHKTPTAK
jgi:tRNA A-37 threonylcarbamoyl transferase component Bud32